jgi:hypothetical protein
MQRYDRGRTRERRKKRIKRGKTFKPIQRKQAEMGKIERIGMRSRKKR